MITNEREFRIVRAQASRLELALAEMAASPTPPDVDPRLHDAATAALKEQVTELREDLEAYQALREGTQTTFDVESLDQLPIALIRARIASGMTQRNLAERLGMREQQIQRYEASHYKSASFARLLEVAHALGVTVRPAVQLAENGWPRLISRLKPYGFTSAFIRSHLLDGPVAEEELNSPSVIRAAWETVARIFESTLEVVAGDQPLVLPAPLLRTSRLKVPKGANTPVLLAYCAYARRLALGAIKASSHIPLRQVPTDPIALRQLLLARYGTIDLSSTLRLAWDLGVVIVPLSDPSGFHGAVWRFEGRNVIFLKQRTRSSARWLIDLLHEIFHAGQEPNALERSVIDFIDFLHSSDEEEEQATEFASDVVLTERAEDLFLELVNISDGQVDRFKGLLPQIAARADVPPDAFANYVAWRLEHNGHSSFNWWGAATNLQQDNSTTIALARDLCFENLRTHDDPDVSLLFRALRLEPTQ